MFRVITPGSVVCEGKLTTIDPSTDECFINFYDGTTVRVNGTHNPRAFDKIMQVINAFQDRTKLANAELNFVNGNVSLDNSKGQLSTVKATGSKVVPAVTAPVSKTKVPPVGNKKRVAKNV